MVSKTKWDALCIVPGPVANAAASQWVIIISPHWGHRLGLVEPGLASIQQGPDVRQVLHKVLLISSLSLNFLERLSVWGHVVSAGWLWGMGVAVQRTWGTDWTAWDTWRHWYWNIFSFPFRVCDSYYPLAFQALKSMPQGKGLATKTLQS